MKFQLRNKIFEDLIPKMLPLALGIFGVQFGIVGIRRQTVQRDLILKLDLGHFHVDGTGRRDTQRPRVFQVLTRSSTDILAFLADQADDRFVPLPLRSGFTFNRLAAIARFAQQTDVTVPAALQAHLLGKHPRPQLILFAKVHETNAGLVQLFNQLHLYNEV